MKKLLILCSLFVSVALADPPTSVDPAVTYTKATGVIAKPLTLWTANATNIRSALEAGLAASYQPLDGDLTSIAALTTTSYGRSALTSADAAAERTRLLLGTMATQSATEYLKVAVGSATSIDVVPTGSQTNIDVNIHGKGYGITDFGGGLLLYPQYNKLSMSGGQGIHSNEFSSANNLVLSAGNTSVPILTGYSATGIVSIADGLLTLTPSGGVVTVDGSLSVSGSGATAAFSADQGGGTNTWEIKTTAGSYSTDGIRFQNYNLSLAPTNTASQLLNWAKLTITGGLVLEDDTLTPSGGVVKTVGRNIATVGVANVLAYGAIGDGSTDDTAAIQAALDAGEPVVYLPDMGNPYKVSDELVVSSNTQIIHDPTTVLRRANSSVGAGDCSFYRNEDYDGTDANITIQGGIFDGNASNNTRSDVSGTPSYVGGVGFRFATVTNLVIRDVTIKNALTFAIHLGHITRGQFDNLYFDNTSPAINNDGLHIGGGCSHIRAKGIRANTTGDDLVAIITDESAPFNMTEGDVSDVIVEDINGTSAYRAVRLLGANFAMSNITIRNVTGSYKTNSILIGNEGLGTEAMQGVLIDGVDTYKSPYNYDAQPTIFVSTPVESLTFRRLVRPAADTSGLPLLQLDPSAGTLNQVTIDGVQAQMAVACDLIAAGCSINQLTVKNVQAKWAGGGSYGGEAFVIGSSNFNQITLSGIQLSGIQTGLHIVEDAIIYGLSLTDWQHETGVDSIHVDKDGTSPVVDHMSISTANFAGLTSGVHLDEASIKSLTITASKFRVVTAAFKITGTIPDPFRISVSSLDQTSISGWISRSASQSISLNGLCCPVDRTILTPVIYDSITDVTDGIRFYNGSSWVAP